MTETPPLHPLEREQLDRATTLVVTVTETGPSDVRESLRPEDRENDEFTPTISFESYEDLLGTFTPKTLELVEQIRTERPSSINEAARIVDRDVKNVHEELGRLARVGVIYFEEEGRSKRPVVWFEELLVQLPIGQDHGTSVSAA